MGALAVAGATVTVIILSYFAVVRSDRSVSQGSTASASVAAFGGAHRPEAGSRSADVPALSGAVTTASVQPRASGSAPVGAATSGAASSAAPNLAMPVGDLPGWHQTLADDFSGTTLGKQWFSYEGTPDGDPGGYFDPGHASVGGQQLTIAGYREPARGNLYATGGVALRGGWAQTYGRYDVRFRMDLGVGLAYVLLLWPKSNRYPPEIDFAEDNGHDRRTMFASLHPPDGSKISDRSVGGDFTQWHTAGLQWTPSLLVFTLDGQPWANIAGSGVPTEPMTLALQSQAWFCGQTWEACPNSSTPTRVNLEIDWAVAYAWTG